MHRIYPWIVQQKKIRNQILTSVSSEAILETFMWSCDWRRDWRCVQPSVQQFLFLTTWSAIFVNWLGMNCEKLLALFLFQYYAYLIVCKKCWSARAELLECGELSLKNDHEWVKSLWVRVRGWDNKGSLVIGFHYKQPDQAEPADEAFFLQLQKTWWSQTLVLQRDFSNPDICWKSSTARSRWSKRLLECIKDNFLSQVLDSPTRGVAVLDLLITNES